MNYYITYFEILAWIASLLAWPFIRTSKYMRLFPLLLSVVVSVEVYLTFFKQSSPYYNAIIYNVQVPLQHLLYLLIIRLSLSTQKFRRAILVMLLFFLVFAVVTTLFYTEPHYHNVLSYSVGTIIIIISILVKFYEMLQSPVNFNFLREPFFYLLFAYLFFCVSTLPFFLMSNWLYFVQKEKEIIRILINVMSVSNFILYSTYTIVFIWIVTRKVYY